MEFERRVLRVCVLIYRGSLFLIFSLESIARYGRICVILFCCLHPFFVDSC